MNNIQFLVFHIFFWFFLILLCFLCSTFFLSFSFTHSMFHHYLFFSNKNIIRNNNTKLKFDMLLRERIKKYEIYFNKGKIINFLNIFLRWFVWKDMFYGVCVCVPFYQTQKIYITSLMIQMNHKSSKIHSVYYYYTNYSKVFLFHNTVQKNKI